MMIHLEIINSFLFIFALHCRICTCAIQNVFSHRFILYQADFIDSVGRFTEIESFLNAQLIEESSQKNAGYSIAETIQVRMAKLF